MTRRPDITCPKTGEMIELDKLSIMKWSDQVYLVHCPMCRTIHPFEPAALGEKEPSR